MNIPKLSALIVALVFAFAALAKLYAIIHDLTYFGRSDFVGTSFSTILVLAEAFLSLALISYFNNSKIWWMVCAFSVALTATAIWNVVFGQATCGCLGVVRTKPIQMLILNLGLVLFSVVAILNLRNSEAVETSTLIPKLALKSTLLITVCTVFLAFAFFSNAGRNVVTVQSQPITSLYALTNGNEKNIGAQVMIGIKNLTSNDVEIIGLETPCKTVFDVTFPVTIEADRRAYLPVRTKFIENSNSGELSFRLYSEKFKNLSVDFYVRVLSPN